MRNSKETVPLGMVSPRPGRVVVIVNEDDTWRLIVHEEAAAWAVTEAAACEAIASLVDLGVVKGPDAVGLCLDLARSCDVGQSAPFMPTDNN